jgi:hypothetical protein
MQIETMAEFTPPLIDPDPAKLSPRAVINDHRKLHPDLHQLDGRDRQ